jgi:hypothetical protein
MRLRYQNNADYRRFTERWQSLGWQQIPREDESGIVDAWIARFERENQIILPTPFCTWNVRPLMALENRDEIETELALSLLNAFRRCTHSGERLIVIDWLHTWCYFDPFGGVRQGTQDEWAYPVLPDYLEAYWYLASDFRFGVLITTKVAVFGQDLLEALAIDPPRQLLSLCHFARKSDRKLWQKLQCKGKGLADLRQTCLTNAAARPIRIDITLEP